MARAMLLVMDSVGIGGAKDAAKYKDYILPLVFTKRLCDVFDDEINRIAQEVGSRKKAFALAKADHKLVRFYLPLVPDDPEQPVWSVIRRLSVQIGEGVTTHMRAIARENPLLQGIIDRVDFNGPSSLLINPEDNDALGVDLDTSPTVVVLQNETLNDFAIRLLDRTDPNSPNIDS